MEELGAEVHDARGCLAIPGLVDLHVHITGGGGEVYISRTVVRSCDTAFIPECLPGRVVHALLPAVQAGPASRTPESQLSAFLDAGITTVVGLLGTDCYNRRQVRPACHIPIRLLLPCFLLHETADCRHPTTCSTAVFDVILSQPCLADASCWSDLL